MLARRILFCSCFLLLAPGCAGFATNIVANAIGGENSAYAYDEDPELVRGAIPFGLKTIESLLQSAPENRKLLLSATSGFTQYSYAFVQQDAEFAADERPDFARAQLERSRRLYDRAYAYGLRGIEAEYEGFRENLEKDPAAAAAMVDDEDDVPFLYWTAATLALRVSISKDDMNIIGQLPKAEAMMSRALALDPDWGDGSIHEFYITYDTTRTEEMGGGLASARKHFERALELTKGKKAGPYVTWAEAVAVPQQDRKLFNEMLDKALAVDVNEEPRFRLVNVIAQNRARWLKAHASDLFLED